MTPSSAFNISSMKISEQIFEQGMAKHLGQSGFAIMPSGDTAFRVRNGMMRIAEKTLDAFPNIEVRLFNPFTHRGSIFWGFLTNMSRVNHRMHNKAFIMDSAFAVVGGRNIGDHYFGLSPNYNFRDLDLFTTGPVAQDITRSFNFYWNRNSKWAMPVSAVTKNIPSGKVTWVCQKNSGEFRTERDPDAGFRRPVSAWFISLFHFLLPIEKQL